MPKVLKQIKRITIFVIAIVLCFALYNSRMTFTGSLVPIVYASGLKVSGTQPISLEMKTFNTSGGKKTAKVIYIDTSSPSIHFEVNTPSSKLNTTQDFEAQVKKKKAFAAINANFFLSYSAIKDPVGYVMVNGEIIYGDSGITTIGITKENKFIFSKPGIFTRMFADGLRNNTMRNDGTAFYNWWAAYSINTMPQSESVSVMYTPARGSSIEIKANGSVATVIEGKLVSFEKVTPHKIVKIPSKGYVTFFGQQIVNKWKGDNGLYNGRQIQREYYLQNNTNGEFEINEMQWMLSGAPDLVINGKIAPKSQHPAFTGARFTTTSTTRTAIGLINKDKLVIVSTSSVKIQELKEIMLALKCKEAVNLDGGGSTGLYYDGKLLSKPIRQLATILYMYKDGE